MWTARGGMTQKNSRSGIEHKDMKGVEGKASQGEMSKTHSYSFMVYSNDVQLVFPGCSLLGSGAGKIISRDLHKYMS